MSATRPVLQLGSAYNTLDEALQALSTVEQTLRAHHDRRAIFATAYLVITGAINQRIKTGWFNNNAWVERYYE